MLPHMFPQKVSYPPAPLPNHPSPMVYATINPTQTLINPSPLRPRSNDPVLRRDSRFYIPPDLRERVNAINQQSDEARRMAEELERNRRDSATRTKWDLQTMFPETEHNPGVALDEWHHSRVQRLLPLKPALCRAIREGAKVITFKPLFSLMKGAAMIHLLHRGNGISTMYVEDRVLEGSGLIDMTLLIRWPGYKDYTAIIPVYFPRVGHITRLQLAIAIAKAYQDFIQLVSTDRSWEVANPGKFRLGPNALVVEDLRLIQIVNLGGRRWQADIGCIMEERGTASA